jgi:hypothetical protein
VTIPHPAITRARTHIKALATELQATATEAPDTPEHVKLFFSGLVVGLATAVRVLDGDSAEKAGEFMETQMWAGIGKALLEGKITAPAPGLTDEARGGGQ